MNVAVPELQTIFDVGSLNGLSDGQLLERFVDRREGAVFQLIVLRHGPTVWGVCRRTLRDYHDAGDAFQATRAYEVHLNDGKPLNEDKEYFLTTVKPICMKIIEGGTWPPGCSFTRFYTLNDAVGSQRFSYDGFWLRLQVNAPKEKFSVFAVPIIGLAYGRFTF